ncbi:MAG TPA: tRNA (adenosine(37)-N6)-dimethylallyltransferase MiaA [Longimicrobiales bacterium]|nr:tRNA (adenosine(37)-N6)-dimethylallyltransferase MiaA [Longimicrobiales bacterium]
MSSSDASGATADPGGAAGGPRSGERAAGIAIVGPTASGKTALSIEVARRVGGEVVSMDSRQVYRGTDIGTAKATAAERAAVPHHGLDLVQPGERFSAGRFAEFARACIRDVRERGAVPILVGGTGFFLRALTHPLFEEPRLDAARRREVERTLESFDDEVLRGWLRALDPVTAASLETGGGRQRMSRALEVALLSGHPLSWWHAHAPAAEAPVPLLVCALELERTELDRRIEARVVAMIEAGLVEEVRALLDRGMGRDAPGMSATGYREIAAYLDGEVSLDEAVRQIQRATRQYARRQRTWFRNQLGADALRLDAARPVGELAAAIVEAWEGERV